MIEKNYYWPSRDLIDLNNAICGMMLDVICGVCVCAKNFQGPGIYDLFIRVFCLCNCNKYRRASGILHKNVVILILFLCGTKRWTLSLLHDRGQTRLFDPLILTFTQQTWFAFKNNVMRLNSNVAFFKFSAVPNLTVDCFVWDAWPAFKRGNAK